VRTPACPYGALVPGPLNFGGLRPKCLIPFTEGPPEPTCMVPCPTESSPFWSMSGVTFTESWRFHFSFGPISHRFLKHCDLGLGKCA
jgi:hypothetical protein